jgi:uncharacterized membrane protein
MGPLGPEKEKNMTRNPIRDLTLTSVFAAIILVMTFVPQLGFITLGITELTLIHIPVLIGVFLLPKRYAFVLGFVFGLGSLLRALQINAGIAIAFTNPLVSILPRLLFVLVSIYLYKGITALEGKFKKSDVVIFSFVALVTIVGVFYSSTAIANFAGWNQATLNFIALILSTILISLYYAFIAGKKKENILFPSVLLLSSLMHTIIVLTAILIFSRQLLVDLLLTENVIGVLVAIAATNGLVEAFLAAVIGTPIILALKQVQENHS